MSTARALRLTVDTPQHKPTNLIGHVARLGVPVVLTARMLLDLSEELGDYERATAWLIELATETGKPAAVNVPTGDDTSTTVLLAPRGWSDEKLKGWVGGMHEELAALFGEASIRAWGKDSTDEA
jgi:hypothetical protein